jgi:O-antigen ligase
VMKLVASFAIGYWGITVLAIIVYVTHFSIGSMSSSTVVMPWQGGLKSILTNGDYTGYGFISTQTGREASFIVSAYYLVAWRYDHRRIHGYLGTLAFALFIAGYGRVPLIGGVVGLSLILLTNQHGTRFWRVAVGATLVVALVTSSGLISKFTNVSARGGAPTEGAATGHLSLWSQHLGLFLERPLTGVGSNATAEQSAEARLEPIIHDPNPLTTEKLTIRGSRGEGGWTGLLAQRGVINGGIILALFTLALTYCFSPFPKTREEKRDMTLVRALMAASLVFYITDVAPFSVYTVTAYVLGQVTMIAAVRVIQAHNSVPRISSTKA